MNKFEVIDAIGEIKGIYYDGFMRIQGDPDIQEEHKMSMRSFLGSLSKMETEVIGNNDPIDLPSVRTIEQIRVISGNLRQAMSIGSANDTSEALVEVAALFSRHADIFTSGFGAGSFVCEAKRHYFSPPPPARCPIDGKKVVPVGIQEE